MVDRPICVNSWYRPYHINARVGGSQWSRHQYGDGADIRSNYLPASKIYRLLRDSHSGGLGKYYSFVHIDWRSEVARWVG
ncbi:MAG: D-Ala-D-Ala carboxypeptidase family metallohydrolase [Waterburya sp.]